MKIEKFQLRGNNSVCAGAFQLLRGRAPSQLRGNIGSYVPIYRDTRHHTSEEHNHTTEGIC
jgi:hypothetical protein